MDKGEILNWFFSFLYWDTYSVFCYKFFGFPGFIFSQIVLVIAFIIGTLFLESKQTKEVKQND